MAAQLEELGYCVIPSGLSVAEVTEKRRQFRADISRCPEFTPEAEDFVMGGFSALGNAGSFHNQTVRYLRIFCRKAVVPVLTELARKRPNHEGLHIEQIIDRALMRPAGQTPSAESWHRDEAPAALPDDEIFGGGLNLDNTDQHFVVVPRTHREASGHSGFAPIKDVDEKSRYKDAQISVPVPPGHIFIFYENLVHCVNPVKKDHDMHRLFLGWRLTRATTPLIENIDALLDEQAVIPLKSGQIPPMHAALHWTNWRGKMEDFSRKNIKAECLIHRTVDSGGDIGKSYRVVKRHMPSLRALADAHPAEFKTYQPYTPAEKNLYKPRPIKF